MFQSGLQITTGGRQTSWLFTCQGVELGSSEKQHQLRGHDALFTFKFLWHSSFVTVDEEQTVWPGLGLAWVQYFRVILSSNCLNQSITVPWLFCVRREFGLG